MSDWTKFESLNVGPTRMKNRKAQIRFADLLLDGVFGNKFIVTDDTRRFRAGYGGGGGGGGNEDGGAGEWLITPDADAPAPPPPPPPKRSGLGRPPGALSASTKAAHQNDKGIDLETGAVYPMVKPEFQSRAKSVPPAKKRSASTPVKPAPAAAAKKVQEHNAVVQAATKVVGKSAEVGPQKNRRISRASTRASSPAPSGGGVAAASASSGGAEDNVVVKAEEGPKDSDITGLKFSEIFTKINSLLEALSNTPENSAFKDSQKQLLTAIRKLHSGTDAEARKSKIGKLQAVINEIKLHAKN
jgi:hypothetical protein